ncbi:MAG: hypothetical protein OXC97_05640, partial [Candidatus Dadabacteria bacterium]|nr:hypothetical protein [Candidatus Dadabacteria bacterium]
PLIGQAQDPLKFDWCVIEDRTYKGGEVEGRTGCWSNKNDVYRYAENIKAPVGRPAIHKSIMKVCQVIDVLEFREKVKKTRTLKSLLEEKK